MIAQLVGAVAAITVGSLLLGRGVNLVGGHSRHAAPAIGLALLIVIARIAIKLPGGAVTAFVILAVLSAAAAVWEARRRSWRPTAAALVAGAIATFGAVIPFIANGRVGLLGVSVDNDTESHVMWANALSSPAVARRYAAILNPGYPLGPHSLIAAVGAGLGVRMDLALTGLLIATVIITAVVAARGLAGEAGWKCVIAGVLGALFYLVASYYGEGAFKETLMALFLLAEALQLEQIQADWTLGSSHRWRAVLPLAALLAAGIYTYSDIALAWLGLTPVLWLAVEALSRPRLLRRWRSQVRDLAAPVAGVVLIVVVLLAPDAGRILNYASGLGLSPAGSGAIPVNSLGNLATPLSPYEALGIWQSATDFRYVPLNSFTNGELSALALGVLILGLVWAVAHRRLVLPAAVAVCALIYWRSDQSQSPYVTAKALVIAGPVVAVLGLRGLLGADRIPIWFAASRLAVAAVFVAFATHSSYEALRDATVWPPESTKELLALDRITKGRTVLFLGNSDYAAWLFKDSQMSSLGFAASLGQATAPPNRPATGTIAFDFDSVAPGELNQFDWVVTTNTSYSSAPPPGLRLVRRLRMYELWRRVGQVPVRQTLAPPGAPGQVVNCGTPAGRALSRENGIASVIAPPIVIPLTGMPPGATIRAGIRLPAGNWDLSLQYHSALDLTLRLGPQRWRMPAYLDRAGPVFAVGQVDSSGSTMILSIHSHRPSALTGPEIGTDVLTVLATRSSNPQRLIPLSRSCGRYVDWFRL